jgi:hypothetical protein
MIVSTCPVSLLQHHSSYCGDDQEGRFCKETFITLRLELTQVKTRTTGGVQWYPNFPSTESSLMLLHSNPIGINNNLTTL